MTQNRPYTVAITGSIATGKSKASEYIKSRGFDLIDFDKIGHEVLEKDLLTKSELVKEFGSGILDKENKVDRRILAKIVFNNRDKMLKLNKITHGRIYRIAQERILESKEEVIFLDIPLLFETKSEHKEFYELVDEIWLISSTFEMQLSRLMIRDKITIDQAMKRISSQMNVLQKKRLADIIFENTRDLDSLYNELAGAIDDLEKRVKNNEN